MVVGALLALAFVPSGQSGLYGRVVISPARPVCVVDQPCTAPDRNDLLAFWRSVRRVATIRTDDKGSYRVSLAPGRYRVTVPRRGRLGSGLTPSAVVVPTGRLAHVNFDLDIGIR
jgi:hypothetical protein